MYGDLAGLLRQGAVFSAICDTIPFIKPNLDPLMISTAAMFVLFPVLSGGMNAFVLFFGLRYWQRRRIGLKVGRKG
jgi:hypothetical protein